MMSSGVDQVQFTNQSFRLDWCCAEQEDKAKVYKKGFPCSRVEIDGEKTKEEGRGKRRDGHGSMI